jgi:hypothetical protein
VSERLQRAPRAPLASGRSATRSIEALESRSNATVMAVVARSLVDLSFLDALGARSTQVRRELGVGSPTERELAPLRIDRLRRFCGFITRVQHNFLWESFPWTIRALRHYRADLDLFADYSYRAQQLRRERAAQETRIWSFLNYLVERLNSSLGQRCPGVADLLRYEEALWTLRSSPGVTEGNRRGVLSTRLPFRDALRSVPVSIHPLAIVPHRDEPLQLIERLGGGLPHGSPLTRSDALTPMGQYVYWLDQAEAEVHCARIDAVSALVLAQVDGQRTFRTVIRRVNAATGISIGRRNGRAVLDAFAELALIGFVRSTPRNSPRGVRQQALSSSGAGKSSHATSDRRRTNSKFLGDAISCRLHS